MYDGLKMTIHSRDFDDSVINTHIDIETPKEAFDIWAQADPEAYGFAIGWNDKVVYSHRLTEYGYETFSYVDGKLHEHKKVYITKDEVLIVKSDSY